MSICKIQVQSCGLQVPLSRIFFECSSQSSNQFNLVLFRFCFSVFFCFCLFSILLFILKNPCTILQEHIYVDSTVSVFNSSGNSKLSTCEKYRSAVFSFNLWHSFASTHGENNPMKLMATFLWYLDTTQSDICSYIAKKFPNEELATRKIRVATILAIHDGPFQKCPQANLARQF